MTMTKMTSSSSSSSLRLLPMLFVTAILLCLSFLPHPVSSAILGMARREMKEQRSVHIRNDSGRRVDVFWINNFDSPVSYVSQSEKQEGIPYGGETTIKSYIGHSFQIRELPGKRSKRCVNNDTCRTMEFTVTDTEGQEVYITNTFQMEFTDISSRAAIQAKEAIDSCHDAYQNDSDNDNDELLSTMLLDDDQDPLQAVVDAISDCMTLQIQQKLNVAMDERDFQSQLRRQMAAELPAYACGDSQTETSEEIWNSTWSYSRRPNQQQLFDVKTYHARPTSEIITIDEFAIEPECAALQSLARVDTDDENNDNGITVVPFDAVNGNTKESWMTHSLAARLYALLEEYTGYNSLDSEEEEGEEKELDFQEQYNLGQELFEIYQDDTKSEGGSSSSSRMHLPVCGSIKDKETAAVTIDSEGNQQTETTEATTATTESPGSCRLPGAQPEPAKTLQFNANGRQVASFFLFCDEQPAALGGIHFPYAGVHINPKKGMAVLAVHRKFGDIVDVDGDGGEEEEDNTYYFDGYAQEYHLCPNHNVYVHTLLEPTTMET